MINPNDPSYPLSDSATYLTSPSPPQRKARAPRLALLATVLFNPVILVGYYLYLYGPSNTCIAGSLVCNFGNYPAIVQVTLILAGCVALWLLLLLLSHWLVETPHGERNPAIRGLRAVTDTSTIQPLLLGYGVALILGLCAGLLKRAVSPPIVMLTVFTIFACLHSALGRRTEEGGAER